jgi:hypothetical protein
VATLVNHDIELQYLTSQGRLETQQRIIQSLRRLAVDSPDAANELPAQQAVLDQYREQHERHRKHRQALRVLAPADGILISATRRVQEDQIPSRLVGWSGLPTDPRNQDCCLRSGDELMSVAGAGQWDAELVLPQSKVARVEIGSRVKLALESDPATKHFGIVTDIARAAWDEQEHGARRDDPSAARSHQPLQTSYVVHVQLDRAAPGFVVGARAQSRIDTKPISVATRLWRFLTGLLRFR